MPIKRNDRHDADFAELMLIRAGQHVWKAYKTEKSHLGGYPTEHGPLWEALQTIWNAKKAYRAEAAKKREAKAVLVRERFKREAVKQ